MNEMQITRRSALALTGRLAVATAAFGASTFRSNASSKRRFKIGACEWSLRKSDPSCFQLAKETGLDGVQVDLGNLKNRIHLRRPEVQQAYRTAAKETGLEIASLATAEFNNIALKSEPRAAIWLHDSIQVAQALGVKGCEGHSRCTIS